MNNYVIINVDVLQERIKELESKSKEFYYREGIDEYDFAQEELEYILSNSIPLIPEIEKAFIEGSHFKEKWVKEIHLIDSDIILQEPDKEKYVSQLKFDI